MAGWLIAAVCIAGWLYVSRKTFHLFEMWVCEQEYKQDELEFEDWMILCVVVLMVLPWGWPLVAVYWMFRPVIHAFFRSPRSKMRAAQERRQKQSDEAYEAVLSTVRDGGDSEVMRDLARAQLAYARSLGPNPRYDNHYELRDLERVR